jgi:hypothetical protein
VSVKFTARMQLDCTQQMNTPEPRIVTRPPRRQQPHGRQVGPHRQATGNSQPGELPAMNSRIRGLERRRKRGQHLTCEKSTETVDDGREPHYGKQAVCRAPRAHDKERTLYFCMVKSHCRAPCLTTHGELPLLCVTGRRTAKKKQLTAPGANGV